MKKAFVTAIAVLIMVICTISFCSCKPIDIATVELNYGNYEQRYDNVNFALQSLNADIIEGSDKALAMEHMLSVADTNLQNSVNVARLAFAEGEAYTGGVGGTMAMRMLYLKHNGAYYYEDAGSLYKANPAAGLSAGKIFVDQASREYSPDLETFYKQNPKYKGKPQMTENFPYFANEYKKAKLSTTSFEERENSEDFGKLTNFVFNRNTVKADTINIGYISGSQLYTLSFELNLEDEAARNEATEKPRAKLREQGSDNLEYVYYKYIIEIWDNGLIRKVVAEESWLGTINVFFMELTGSSHSISKEYYSWDPSDSAYLEQLDLSWAE